MKFNDQVRKVLLDLLYAKEPEIVLRGDVDADMEEYVFWAMAKLRGRNCPPVTITIDSPGGSSDRGHDIFDIIKLYPGNTTGIGFSRVDSSAALIIQACNTRCLNRHAKMCIHNPSRNSVSLDELTSKKKLAELIADLKGYQKILIAVFAGRSGKSQKVIRAQLAKDTHMNAQEALAFGLVDKIV